MKILVIGGMHGNEPLGPQLVESLTLKPIPGISTLLANPRAHKADKRFIDQDLNRSFPGDLSSPLYEPQLAAQIMIEAAGHDLILDFHNTLASDNDCSFIGDSADPSLLRVTSYLGLKRVIVADYDCINKFVPNCISMELSVDSPRIDIDGWRSQLSELANTELNLLPRAIGLRFFRYVMTVTNKHRDELKLSSHDLKPFKPMPHSLSAALGVKHPAYPIFVGKNYSAEVYAGLLNTYDRVH